jgi:hypothetical protein
VPGGRRQKAEDRRQKAGGRRQKAEDRRQKAEGRRQKAGGRRQKAEDRRQKTGGFYETKACQVTFLTCFKCIVIFAMLHSVQIAVRLNNYPTKFY